MRTRPTQAVVAVRLAAVAVVAASAVYLTWRLTSTIAWDAWWISVPFFLLEVHLAVRIAMTVAELWDPEARTALGAPGTAQAGPDVTVAVLVPTLNEGVEVLLPTVAAALVLEPAHETWILDDGDRPEIEEMARRLGAGYIARRSSEHAKAGNLNHALAVVDADIIAILDADHVPLPELLTATLPYFADPEVALVQTPQEFYNRDSFVHADGDFHEEMFFHRVIQPGKNRYGAAFWCGTGSIVRTRALRAVGGASTYSITEDLHTTVALHRAGWRTIHHNEPLAQGLAPRSYDEFRRQRWRWGAGAMQCFALDGPLRDRRLRPGQRLAYLASYLSWFDSWRTLGFLLAPMVVLITGVSPMKADLAAFLAVSATVGLMQLLIVKALARGRLRLWFAAVFDVLRLPANLSSTLVYVRPTSLGFLVTPKGRSEDGRRRGSVPALLRWLRAASFAAWVYGVASLLGVTPTSYGSPGAALVALGWLTVNHAVITAAVVRITDPRFAADQRASFRLSGPLQGRCGEAPATVVDLSLTGSRLLTPVAQAAVGDEITVAYRMGVPIELTARVRAVSQRAGGYEVRVEHVDGQWFELADLATALLRRGRPPRRSDVALAQR